MARLLVHVEGETEETFVNEILASRLYEFGYTVVSARSLGNSRQRERRGGIRSWNAVRGDILRHLTEDATCLATTMVDFYALPSTPPSAWPGRDSPSNLPYLERARLIEDALSADICKELGCSIDQSRFLPYVMMHEFEGLLFSDCERFGQGIGMPELTPHFQAIRDQFTTPEEINDSPITAPSKRVAELVRGYQKPFHGNLAALEIGLDAIRNECPHFRTWLEKLEAWPQ